MHMLHTPLKTQTSVGYGPFHEGVTVYMCCVRLFVAVYPAPEQANLERCDLKYFHSVNECGGSDRKCGVLSSIYVSAYVHFVF